MQHICKRLRAMKAEVEIAIHSSYQSYESYEAMRILRLYLLLHFHARYKMDISRLLLRPAVVPFLAVLPSLLRFRVDGVLAFNFLWLKALP